MLKLLYLFLPALLFAEVTRVSLFTFNDSYELLPSEEGTGGLASMMTLLEKEREKCDYSLTALNGDFMSPLYLGSWDKGAHLIDMLNRMKVDFALLGNHEFDYGSVELKKRMAEAKFSWIASNLIELSGKPFSGNRGSKIYDYHGVKVGVFGLVQLDRQVLSDQGYDLRFLPIVDVARRITDDLRRQGADVIVAFTELSFSEERRLAIQVPKINVIVGGNKKGPLFWYEGRTLIYESTYDDHFLARIDLVVEKKMSHGQMMVEVQPCFRCILNHEINPNEEISDRLQFYYKKFNVDQ